MENKTKGTDMKAVITFIIIFTLIMTYALITQNEQNTVSRIWNSTEFRISRYSIELTIEKTLKSEAMYRIDVKGESVSIPDLTVRYIENGKTELRKITRLYTDGVLPDSKRFFWELDIQKDSLIIAMSR